MTRKALNTMRMDELKGLYFETFGSFFGIQWGDDDESYRPWIIDCIASGIPQDESKIPGFVPTDGSLL